VKSDAISGDRPTLSRKAGTTADAENHNDMVATAQKAIIRSERARTDTGNLLRKDRLSYPDPDSGANDDCVSGRVPGESA
jgi:hypothetical protein